MKKKNYILLSRKSKKKWDTGFSLIEILVASAIASIIILMISTTYKSTLDSIIEISEYSEFYENINLALFRIDNDFSNIYYNSLNKNISFIGDIEEDNSILNFVSVIQRNFNVTGDIKRPSPSSDIKEVGYYLKPDTETGNNFILIRREENHFDDEPENGGEENLFLENVSGLKFEFKQGNDWTDKWDSRQTKKIPEAIKTTLKVINYRNKVETFNFISYINAH